MLENVVGEAGMLWVSVSSHVPKKALPKNTLDLPLGFSTVSEVFEQLADNILP